MKVLAIDTATEACSAALMINGDIIERFKIAPREHGELILLMIDELLLQAGITLQQLDGLAFGCGPGSFTGVRMATGVVQGLAFSSDLPVAPVSTLKALAQQAINLSTEGHRVYAALDARMGEVYWCEYKVINGELSPCSAEQVIAANKIKVAGGQKAIGIGHGWDTYRDELTDVVKATELTILPSALPRAREIVQLGAEMLKSKQTVAAENAMPVYLRDNVAKKKAQQ